MFRLADSPHRSLRWSPSLAAFLLRQRARARTAEHPRRQPAAELRVFDPSLIDKTVDPCENFYRFSCNGWFKRNSAARRPDLLWPLYRAVELNRLHLKQILEAAAATRPPRTANEQKIGDEYASCMDTAAINKLGLSPLLPELDRIAALKTAADCPPCWRTCIASA